jgi:hypothetical protein
MQHQRARAHYSSVRCLSSHIIHDPARPAVAASPCSRKGPRAGERGPGEPAGTENAHARRVPNKTIEARPRHGDPSLVDTQPPVPLQRGCLGGFQTIAFLSSNSCTLLDSAQVVCRQCKQEEEGSEGLEKTGIFGFRRTQQRWRLFLWHSPKVGFAAAARQQLGLLIKVDVGEKTTSRLLKWHQNGRWGVLAKRPEPAEGSDGLRCPGQRDASNCTLLAGARGRNTSPAASTPPAFLLLLLVVLP